MTPSRSLRRGGVETRRDWGEIKNKIEKARARARPKKHLSSLFLLKHETFGNFQFRAEEDGSEILARPWRAAPPKMAIARG